jgi:phosphate/sulfate permease
LWAGVDLAAAGLVVLIVRNLLGHHVVGALADPAVRPAAEAAWSTGTALLRDTAQAAILAAIPVILGAVLAGPLGPAVAIRRRLAPALREHEGAAYALLGAVVLLIVAWGPIPATRKAIPVLIMAALAAVGVRALRRQTLEEFPAGAAAGGDGQVAAAGATPR